MAEQLDPSRCAICGEPNECGMARGDSECWCFDATIPRKTLDLVPLAARDKVCVCAKCAAKGAEPVTLT
ncbi:MAG TPA: cysteine-rich CWC family protein [Polyangiaceae bacterium]|jgi:hypothetical protein|nr:cysteine-rich CWC family protein [Polyangiaceae bacterium]